MNDKVSLWTLFGVAAIALVLMAIMSDNTATGEFTGPRPPRAIPAPRPPPRVVVDRSPVVVDDYDAADEAMADRMAHVEKATCYLINLQLDTETPPDKISSRCPTWVYS